ncbi:hypothetical protein [Aquabacterium sp.]|uniref:hypothetical protein n=1 Tax=Aquabacterium sp. TaxID=1872578 RepID=UPI0035AE159A
MSDEGSVNQWWSLGRVVDRVWQVAFTAPGALVFALMSAWLAYWGRTPSAWIDYVAEPLIAGVGLFLAGLFVVVASSLGDVAAMLVLSKLVKQPDTGNLCHQAVALSLSVACFGAFALLMSLTRPLLRW